ncbi:XrtA/PEP-CTERM system histidine kinase PrsK [Kangiella sp. TOML190]|uniref:XrtA/PEP-CTERM system histidine kinase PrsK n=1 Tax=Kangiella sp. TOML190 TaxID=2931351 RepID=UPI00203F5404|nr:XrtA/PEP-CTERM system histidine kinase PrsK [Kangiella sp. TOML190]
MGIVTLVGLIFIFVIFITFSWKDNRFSWLFLGFVVFFGLLFWLFYDLNRLTPKAIFYEILLAIIVSIVAALFWYSYDKRKRSQFKISFAKVFSFYKYDYRESWLGFNSALDFAHREKDFYAKSIQALASIIDSSGGKLWYQVSNRFSFIDHWDSPLVSNSDFKLPDSLIEFMQKTNWVVDLNEFRITPEVYRGLSLDLEQHKFQDLHIFVPLRRENELVGIVGLKVSDEQQNLNWEDHDLLKAAGQQMASYIELFEATSRLYEQRELEAFNRVSTFVVHDIKNVSAQLELISHNAEKFKNNPEFIEDTFATVASANQRLTRMLQDLRRKEIPKVESAVCYLASLKAKVAEVNPLIKIEGGSEAVLLIGLEDQLCNIILHLDENARQAVAADKAANAKVEHWIEIKDKDLYWHIRDNGVGMSEEFMRDHLFKPFQTTKGNAGMGIGVYQCRHLLRSFEGDLIIRSKLGEGTHCTAIMAITTGDEDDSK